MSFAKSRTSVCAALITLVFSIPATPHPHMFIDVSAKFMLDDSGLAGIYIYWEFDEMNSMVFIDEFDANKNGMLEKNEIETIKKEAFSYTATSGYFTGIFHGADFLNIEKVEKFNAKILPGGILRYSFYVPCNIPAVPEKDISVFWEDPSIFIAFTLKKNEIQVSEHERVNGVISFIRRDYNDIAILYLSKKDGL